MLPGFRLVSLEQKLKKGISILVEKNMLPGPGMGNTLHDVAEIKQNGVRVIFSDAYKDIRNLSENSNRNGMTTLFTDDTHFNDFEIVCSGRDDFLKPRI